MQRMLALLFSCLLFSSVTALRPSPTTRVVSTRLNENFGFKFAEDSYANTPAKILGEVNYKTKFVKSYKPDALVVGDASDLVTAIRKNQLLKTTAESGLLEALESQGLTFSQIEKLLPFVDELGLLPLAAKNKGLILSLAPLLIETAFLGLPLAASVVGTSPSTYSGIAAACFALAGYEGLEGNTFLLVLLVLLGSPAALLAQVLGSIFGPIRSVPSSSSFTPSFSSNSGSAPAKRRNNDKIVGGNIRVSSSGSGGQLNGKRKTIRL